MTSCDLNERMVAAMEGVPVETETITAYNDRHLKKKVDV
jgi:hypothetical protein